VAPAVSAIAAVEERLAELRGGERGQARTQLLDLVVLTDDPREADRMARLLEVLPGNRPSRAIIALATSTPQQLDASAEIVATAPPSGDGAELRCELVRLAAGDEGAALPSLIASLLLPDLPVFMLLRLDPERWEPLVTACWSFATRVVVDSTGERSGLHSLPGLLAREPKRSVTDLSWTKLTGWRELVARLFDPPRATRALARLDRIELTHAGRSRAQARLLAAWILSRTGRHPSVELTSERRRDMRSGSLISVVATCRKERYDVVRLAEGVAEVRSPYLEPQRARLWVPHLPALIAEELGIYERDEAFEAAIAQLAT
jgi:glucose-6-phosphate dehydrogenase assembly protein OpcA